MRELIRRKSKECMNRLVRSGIKGSQEKGRKEDSSGSENILQENLTPKLPVFENESEEFELLHPYELQNLLLPSPPLAQADTKSNIYTHYTGVPASRLHLHPYQRLLMKAQLSQHRSRDLFEESFYHQWNVLGVTSNKELRLEMIIETKYELELFHQNLTAKKIHIFRDGVYPRKQSLTNGFTIVLKVVEESNALKLFSSVTYPILSNNIYGGANVLQSMYIPFSYYYSDRANL